MYQVIFLRLLNKINLEEKTDTLFLLELNGVQGDYYLMLWNKKDTISYSNLTGNFILDNSKLFSKYTMLLVSDWNISKIRSEEVINKDHLPSEIIYATKIIVKRKKKVKVDCIRFYSFTNWEIEREFPSGWYD